jgi:hypothetical protein
MRELTSDTLMRSMQTGGLAMNELDPVAGQWYLRPDGLKFEVIDIDEDGLIEVQNQDGTLDEIDVEDWPKINLELVPQSEDATASFDNVPFPDEADGGDPVDIESVMIEPQRVALEEITADDVADEDDKVIDSERDAGVDE